MKISSNEKQQIFYDSFDMFKDDWSNNKRTLIKSISGIAAFDVEAAIQMWIYLLENNPLKIKTDSEITGGILKALPNEVYSDIDKNTFIKNALYKNSSEPWESVSLINFLMLNADFYSVNELFEIIFQNKNTSEYNYSGYTSSNISTCLFYTIDRLYNFNEEDIDFLSEWIERIEDNNERMKLKVLLLSKEKREDTFIHHVGVYTDNNSKNDYLLESASLEDLDLASADREKFEIKKIMESICNDSISSIDFSRLDVNWLYNLFLENSECSESNFNIIGAYYTYKGMSWGTQKFLENIYKNKVSIESLWKNSYNGETEFSINQRLQLVLKSINDLMPQWNFNSINNFSAQIILLCEAYGEYLSQLGKGRDKELLQYTTKSINELKLTNRVINALARQNIESIPELVRLIDAGIHVEGVGEKSLNEIYSKLHNIDISTNAYSLKNDFNFIFQYLRIEADANEIGIFKIAEILGIKDRNWAWKFGRADLLKFMEDQGEIARHFLNESSCLSNDRINNMSQLKKDKKSIYQPGLYFFSTISDDNFNVSF